MEMKERVNRVAFVDKHVERLSVGYYELQQKVDTTHVTADELHQKFTTKRQIDEQRFTLLEKTMNAVEKQL